MSAKNANGRARHKSANGNGVKPETTVQTGEMRPGPRGGMLRVGGKPGNKGGPGATPSVIRERLRGSFQKRIWVLEQIAEDPHVSTADRMRAIDLLAKYGLGTTVTETDTEGRDTVIRVVRVDRTLNHG